MKRTRQAVIHGGARHPVYNTWFKMIARCTDPENKDYRHYGGRGLTVCDRWLDFSKFVEDMLPSWKNGLTLGRKQNDEGYSPENCQWETRQQQALNSRWNHKIGLDGVTKTIVEWSRDLGINRLTIHSRLLRGWSEEEALTVPVKKIHRL